MMQIRKTLKQASKSVAEVMPNGFTDAQFFAEFQKLKPVLWIKVYEVYEEYKYMNARRAKNGKKIIPIAHPNEMLEHASKSILNITRENHKRNSTDEEARIKQYKILESKAQKKITEYKQRILDDTYFIQEVTPPYVKNLIVTYYDERKKDALNINTRYLIIREAGKFKSKETIRFLKRVQSGEKNEQLRMAAYKVLLQMHAPHVVLHHKRDGKMTESRSGIPNPQETPNALLRNIYDAEFEKIKSFDVFVSHSSQNKELIHDIMKLINAQGLVCYIDWVEDREQLRRELSSKDTAEVIINRIKQSKVFVYVLTKECVASKWSPWELGYAHAIGKPIFVIQIDEIDDKPEYLDLYPICTIDNLNMITKIINEE